MWDLPGPGIEPVSPVLAGGFLTTVPPGKSHYILNFVNKKFMGSFSLLLHKHLHDFAQWPTETKIFMIRLFPKFVVSSVL